MPIDPVAAWRVARGEAVTREQAAAITRRILAVEDLLEACQAFTAWDEDPHATEADAVVLRRTVAAAILKATGEAPCAATR